jgi:hypothetical protein
METHNKFFVSMYEGGIVILQPPTKAKISADDALLLAAWIVACADPDGSKFLRLLASLKGDQL